MSNSRTQTMRGMGAAALAPQDKRRPPNPREQAKRKAWGKQWGAYLSAAAKELRKDAA